MRRDASPAKWCRSESPRIAADSRGIGAGYTGVMRRIALISVVLSFFSALSGAQTPAKAPSKSGLDKATLEQYVRHLFVWGPQIQVKVSDPKPSTLSGFQQMDVVASAGNASQEETFLISNDGKKIVRGVVYDVAENPFDVEKGRIKTDEQPSFGPAAAPVQLVIYSDFQCSFCREEAKVIRQTLAPTYPEQVRVIFKDFPLEPIHPWAKPAAIAGRCIYRQKPAAFWDFHDWVFENQGTLTVENLKEKILEFGKGKGIEPIQLGGCIDAKSTEAEVIRSMAEARTVGVNSTPTMFVNGRRLVGRLEWAQLKSVIDHEIEYQKTRGGEKCCELTLTSPSTK
jgi:protein-disulfide isomerase